VSGARRRVVAMLCALAACDGATEEPAASPPPAATASSAAPAPVPAAPAPPPASAPNSDCPTIVATEELIPGVLDRVDAASYAADVVLPKIRAWDTIDLGPVVVVTRRSICVDGDAVARVDDGRLVVDDLQGHLIPALRDRIEPLRTALAERVRARGEEPVDGVVLFVDRHTRQSTLIDIFYTANRAGFRAYMVALDAEVPANVPFAPGIELEPPKFSADGKPGWFRPKHELRIDIDLDALTIVEAGGKERRVPFDHESPADLESLTKLARARVGRSKWEARTAPVVVYAAANDVVFDRVVAVLGAVAGPSCDFHARMKSDAERCAFPRAIVQAESAR
jgi:hypothetical protein